MKCSALRVAASVLLAFPGAVFAQQESASFFSNCLIRPAEHTELASAVQEVAVARPVALGQRVREGEALIEFGHAALDARLARLENEIGFAERALARGERLGNLLPDAERDELSNAVARARADAAEVRAERDRYILRAPHAGIIVDTPLSVGELATDQPVMTIIDVSTLRAEISVPAALHGRYSVGQSLVLRSETGAEKRGTISFVDPVIDFGSRTFRLHADVDNADNGWLAGLSCTVVF